MTYITLSSKNQVVIPKEVRKKLKLKSGDRLILEKTTDNRVVFIKEQTILDFIGILPYSDTDPVTDIRKMRDESTRATDQWSI
jgi:AbrB family looped-hinge helix DNA binding protein